MFGLDNALGKVFLTKSGEVHSITLLSRGFVALSETGVPREAPPALRDCILSALDDGSTTEFFVRAVFLFPTREGALWVARELSASLAMQKCL